MQTSTKQPTHYVFTTPSEAYTSHYLRDIENLWAIVPKGVMLQQQGKTWLLVTKHGTVERIPNYYTAMKLVEKLLTITVH